MKEKKKLTYKERQKKEKRKLITKWVFVGLGWTALLGLFGGMVALGVKSCANKQNKTVEQPNVIERVNYTRDNQNDVHYVLNVNGYPFDYADCEHFIINNGTSNNGIYNVTENKNFVIGLDIHTSSHPSHPNTNGYLVNYLVGLRSANMQTFYSYWVSINELKIPVTQAPTIELTTQLTFYSSTEQIDDIDGDITVQNAWGLLLGLYATPINNEYIEVEMVTDIDRFAIFNVDNSLTVLIGADRSGTYTIFNGVFTDQSGTIYTKIKLEYMNIDGEYYIDYLGHLKQADRTDVHYTAYKGMYYTDLNGNDILVNECRYTTVGGQVALYNYAQWNNVQYRFLKIYKSYIVYNNSAYTGQDGIRNLELLNDSTIHTGGDGNALYDVFDLISMAFRSIASILGITILPGVTLGTLIFIPVVAIIVIFIVWLFKR